MTFLDRTRGTDDARPVWFLVERERHGGMAFASPDKATALTDFGRVLAEAAAAGEAYSPHQPGRALQVTGPDVHERAGDDDAVLYIADRETLPPADIRLREALGDDYWLLAHGPRAAAVLES